MAINKIQCQFLLHVRLNLKKQVFNLGQLYVVVSRVTNWKGLKIIICDKDEELINSITNVVFKEVF